jgi:hypothetical protein
MEQNGHFCVQHQTFYYTIYCMGGITSASTPNKKADGFLEFWWVWFKFVASNQVHPPLFCRVKRKPLYGNHLDLRGKLF